MLYKNSRLNIDLTTNLLFAREKRVVWDMQNEQNTGTQAENNEDFRRLDALLDDQNLSLLQDLRQDISTLLGSSIEELKDPQIGTAQSIKEYLSYRIQGDIGHYSQAKAEFDELLQNTTDPEAKQEVEKQWQLFQEIVDTLVDVKHKLEQSGDSPTEIASLFEQYRTLKSKEIEKNIGEARDQIEAILELQFSSDQFTPSKRESAKKILYAKLGNIGSHIFTILDRDQRFQPEAADASTSPLLSAIVDVFHQVEDANFAEVDQAVLEQAIDAAMQKAVERAVEKTTPAALQDKVLQDKAAIAEALQVYSVHVFKTVDATEETLTVHDHQEKLRREYEEKQICKICNIDQENVLAKILASDSEWFAGFRKTFVAQWRADREQGTQTQIANAQALWAQYRKEYADTQLEKLNTEAADAPATALLVEGWEKRQSDVYDESDRNAWLISVMTCSKSPEARTDFVTMHDNLDQVTELQTIEKMQQSFMHTELSVSDMNNSLVFLDKMGLTEEIDNQTFQERTGGGEESSRFAFYDTKTDTICINSENRVFSFWLELVQSDTPEQLPIPADVANILSVDPKGDANIQHVLHYIASTLTHELEHAAFERKKDYYSELHESLRNGPQATEYETILQDAIRLWPSKQLQDSSGEPNTPKIMSELEANRVEFQKQKETGYGVVFADDINDMLSRWIDLTSSQTANSYSASQAFAHKQCAHQTSETFQSIAKKAAAMKVAQELLKKDTTEIRKILEQKRNGEPLDYLDLNPEQEAALNDLAEVYGASETAGTTAGAASATGEVGEDGEPPLVSADYVKEMISSVRNDTIPIIRKLASLQAPYEEEETSLADDLAQIEDALSDFDTIVDSADENELVEMASYLRGIKDSQPRMEELINGIEQQPRPNFLSAIWQNTRFLSTYDIGQMITITNEWVKRRYERHTKGKIGDVGARLFKDLPYLETLGEEFRSVSQTQENQEVSNYKSAFEQYSLQELIQEVKNPQNQDSLKAAIEVLVDLGNFTPLITSEDHSEDVYKVLREYSGLAVYNESTARDAIDAIWGKPTATNWMNNDSSNMESEAGKAETQAKSAGGNMIPRYKEWIRQMRAANEQGRPELRPNFTEVLGGVKLDLETGGFDGEISLPLVQEMILEGGLPDHAVNSIATGLQNVAPVFALLTLGNAKSVGLYQIYKEGVNGRKKVTEYMQGRRLLYLKYDPESNYDDKITPSTRRHWVSCTDFQAGKSAANRKASHIAEYDQTHMRYIYPSTSRVNLLQSIAPTTDGERGTMAKRVAGGVSGIIDYMNGLVAAEDATLGEPPIDPSTQRRLMQYQMRNLLEIIESCKKYKNRDANHNRDLVDDSMLDPNDKNYSSHVSPGGATTGNFLNAQAPAWDKKMIAEKGIIVVSKDLDKAFARRGISLGLEAVIRDTRQTSPLDHYARIMKAIDDYTEARR